MLINELIKMLEEAKEKYGNFDVCDPLCPCPAHEEATVNMPERLVI